MTFDEWKMCELLLTILLPFKRASHSLQTTSRSSIDEVFWIYETLFSKINQLKDTFHFLQYKDLTWVYNIHQTIDKMTEKLNKHYKIIDKSFVYSDAVILEPCGKLTLFEQPNMNKKLTSKYEKACRRRYTERYE